MAVSGLQRLTVAAVLVLCAALILPRVLLRRESSEDPAPGRFPPMMHRHVAPDLRGQRSAGVRGHGEVRGTGGGGAGTGSGGAGTGSGPGAKSNLAAQIIPVYGFGILLYILYILFKITSKGHSKPSQSRLQSLRSENNKRKITDFELSQLQERLRETELVMENLVNTTLQEDRLNVSVDQEQNLLQQLTEITRAMKSNHLVQDFSHSATVEEETDLMEPFWSHCSCRCPQSHKEELALEDQPTFLCSTSTEEDTDLRTNQEEDHEESLDFRNHTEEPQTIPSEDQEPDKEPPGAERDLQPQTEGLQPEEEHQENTEPWGGHREETEEHQEKTEPWGGHREETEEHQENTEPSTGHREETEEHQENTEPSTGHREDTEEQQENTEPSTGHREDTEEQQENTEPSTGHREETEEHRRNTEPSTGHREETEEHQENTEPSTGHREETEEHQENTEPSTGHREETEEHQENTEPSTGHREETEEHQVKILLKDRHLAPGAEDVQLSNDCPQENRTSEEEQGDIHTETGEEQRNTLHQEVFHTVQTETKDEERTEETGPQTSQMFPQTSQMFPQTSEEKVPEKRAAPSGVRRRNRRRRARRL